MAIYGGFAGTETLRSERDVSWNRTVLSGDLDMDGDTSDNAYHVVTGATGATIDGFTISGGNADGNSADSWGGGGMYNSSSSPTVTDCTFSENVAYNGGGMYNSYSSPTVTNCTFSENAANVGGGMRNINSSPTVTDCTFSENAAYTGGGMRSSSDSSPTVTNCTFSENAADYGGGMSNYSSDSSLTVTNCTFSENAAKYGGGMYNHYSSPTVTNCIFWDDSASSSGPEIYNTDYSTTITYSIVEGGYTGTGNLNADPLFVSSTDLRLQSGSPAIDVGDDTAVPAGVTTDLDGNPRFACDAAAYDAGVDAGADGGAAGCPVDMGAYEYQP